MTKTEYKTIRVPKPAYDDAKAQKEANNRTWGQQLVRPDDDTAHGTIDRERLAEDRQEQLEDVVGGVCGDCATEESVADLANLLREVDGIDAEALAKKVAADTEHAAYRGAKDAIEEHL